MLLSTEFNQRFYSCLLLGSLLLISGCASLKKGECLEGDWGGIGFRDGAAGRDSASRLVQHTKACGKHGVTPDHALYNEGHAQGLVNFCTAPEGYNYGTSASEYHGNCPVDLETAFLKGYVDGLKEAEYRTENELDRLDDRKDDAQLRYSLMAGRDDTDPKKLRKARSRVDNLRSSITTTRQQRRKIRRLIDVWSSKLLEGV